MLGHRTVGTTYMPLPSLREFEIQVAQEEHHTGDNSYQSNGPENDKKVRTRANIL